MVFFQGLIALYGSVLFAVGMFQERLIFFPDVLPANYEFSFLKEYEEHWLKLGEDQVHSVLFKASDAVGVILFFHGNAGSMEGWGPVAEEIVEKSGWDVWIVDFPGYGKSGGRITSERQLLDLGVLLLKEARNKYDHRKKIVLYGRSIGSGIAVNVASKNKVDGLVLESPFYSMMDLAKRIYPWVPTAFMKYKFRSDLWIPSVRCPILILHGTKDEIVPFEQGQRLAETSKRATLTGIQGGHHNNLETFPEYWTALERFLKSL